MKDPMNDYRGMRVTVADGRAEVARVTREAEVQVAVSRGARREPSLATGIAFFDHMLEMIAWHAGLNLDVTFAKKTYALRHVVTEDIGMAFGLGINALLRQAMADGVEGAASASMAMDESLAFCALSFEGRSMHFIDRESPGSQLEWVEDMLGADMVAFYEGFAQGARCTLRLKVTEGRDPHHAWEAAARAFAVALRRCFDPMPFRAGLTAGVKGTLD
jgi:imidazoleglycerol-phosphate dehydratase